MTTRKVEDQAYTGLVQDCRKVRPGYPPALIQAAVTALGEEEATARITACCRAPTDGEGMLDVPYTAELHMARRRAAGPERSA